MIALVAALLLLGIMLGAVVQLPAAASIPAAAVIGVWLIVFAVRERRSTRLGRS
ncbi:hypothetical protein [Streptomyces sp. MUM 178J]|uniref:hypothetical protein n=1 Tax=Streptomyces sp. MUM 178J TaxID=2791991 RepID=UPI001F049EC8|nr:hypothetical protein [Streptomyces sp. MUM 178J]WRQ81105.1 hypothetical protein I3F59_018100 [Streptomyces sp. MUM 178J]